MLRRVNHCKSITAKRRKILGDKFVNASISSTPICFARSLNAAVDSSVDDDMKANTSKWSKRGWK